MDIIEGEYVIVEAERGQDMGKASLIGALVRLKKGKGETRSIVRIAKENDIEILRKNQEKEKSAFQVCREKIKHFKLEMKLVGVEIQFDGSKITFYFTAAQRVDFRELVKDLASVYRTRIELRQIGVRDEAKRVGGCGICGRKQCCNSFLTEFEQITTQMAKDQQLALNPTKISGNCGRLLCCLRYENEQYQEIFAEFPPVGSKVTIDEKQGTLSYINIFENKGLVHFSNGSQQWLPPQEFKKGTFEYAS
ncbi:Signal peptidase-like protein [Chitinispirillum alkaliphilum]|nr:Signal peptidase-like protein [Chitinispirillum alkaliphilum]